MTTKTATSWIPQPFGFGYVTQTGTIVDLTTQAGVKLTTQLLVPLSTNTELVVGKFATKWAGTGV
jgi:hypothetical protein